MGRIHIIEKAAETGRKSQPAAGRGRGQISPRHSIQDSINIVSQNIYAKRCIDEIYKTTVGRGLQSAPDEWKKILTQDFLERVDKDYLKTGNAFMEVVVLSGKVIALYHVPVLTMAKFRNESGGYYYKQPAVKNGPEYQPYTGQPETGNYILHLMDYEDDEHYGCPFWMGAEAKITQTTYADQYNSNFFANDCRPGSLVLGKGLGLKEEEENTFQDFLRKGFKGAGNSRKTLALFTDKEAEIKIEDLAGSQIDMSFINLIRDNKTDICAAFRVPPKLVGLETPGRLGGGNDFAVQVNIFYENEIIPRQVYYEEIFSGMAGAEILFNRPKTMEISSQALPAEPEPVEKATRAELTDILRLIADRLAD